MQRAAHLAASIEILDAYLAGAPLEKALTNWARRSRFAGSKDRAAIRDIVFQIVRCRRSCVALSGGAESGRALAIGYVARIAEPFDAWFGASHHGPPPLTDGERGAVRSDLALPDVGDRLDCPEWLVDHLAQDLGCDFEAVLSAMQQRAPIHLRVNVAKGTRTEAKRRLASEGIHCDMVDHCNTALEVTENARRIAHSEAYKSGLVELQDAASQLACEHLPGKPRRVLDLCAGGGGKALALAANLGCEVWAHDIAPQRLKDLPERAARAGARILILPTEELQRHAPFDAVFCDAPCSGSGAWRRAPEGKWALTSKRLKELQKTQSQILDQAASLLAPHGCLVYATCSLLRCENEDQVGAFLNRHQGWQRHVERRLTPLDGCDGFYFTYLTREKAKD